jgi:hypothetical protein
VVRKVKNEPAVTGVLVEALGAIRLLTDAEQLVVKAWLDGSGDTFPLLSAATATLSNDAEAVYSPSASLSEFMTLFDRIVTAVSRIGSLLPTEYDAIAEWFMWHDRAALHRLSVADLEIGPSRIVPDDIWPQEPQHEAVADGTLRFELNANGTVIPFLRFEAFEFTWDELYAHLQKTWG